MNLFLKLRDNWKNWFKSYAGEIGKDCYTFSSDHWTCAVETLNSLLEIDCVNFTAYVVLFKKEKSS